MRVCVLFYDMQEFGGLEEIATTLAIGMTEEGHQVSVVSTAWVPPNNQYLLRLQQHRIPVVQLPRWLSAVASDWATKEKMLTVATWLVKPLIYLLASGILLLRRKTWRQALVSSQGWVRGQLMKRFIGKDRREPLMRILLSWWQWRWQPDILHIHGYTNTTLFALDWAGARRLPVVYEEHTTPDPQFDWWQGFHKVINKAKVVVAVSEKSVQALQDVCGVTRPIVVMGPIVVDPITSGWKENDRKRLDSDPITITTVARLHMTKGLNYLLEAVVQIRTNYPDTQFKVYGDGALRQKLLAYAHELGLDGEAIFVGAFTDRNGLTKILNETDVFVISSILEGQPLALVEAMAHGCPIVTTAVGGIPELIEDGVNGLLCPPGDSVCLAQKIATLIADPALRLQLGRAARYSYEQGPFQPAAVSRFFIDIYERVLSNDSSFPNSSVGIEPILPGRSATASKSKVG
jgi:glycosyltransferase involved in cell wall biosynthesis